MLRAILIFSFFISSLVAKECSPYFNPEKYYEVPEALAEFIDETIGGKLFSKQISKAGFSAINKNTFRKDQSVILQGDYVYPNITGLWQYHVKDGQIDELNIARKEIYRFKDEEIANSVNDDFDNFWMDYNEDGYTMQLTPEQTLFRYNGEYFTFSVYIYGVIGDATTLKGTVVNFWFKNYTNQVNEYIQCDKENNASR